MVLCFRFSAFGLFIRSPNASLLNILGLRARNDGLVTGLVTNDPVLINLNGNALLRGRVRCLTRDLFAATIITTLLDLCTRSIRGRCQRRLFRFNRVDDARIDLLIDGLISGTNDIRGITSSSKDVRIVIRHLVTLNARCTSVSQKALYKDGTPRIFPDLRRSLRALLTNLRDFITRICHTTVIYLRSRRASNRKTMNLLRRQIETYRRLTRISGVIM